MLLADDHPSSKYEEDGTLTPIGVIQRPWYTGAVRTGGVYITDVLADAFTGQIGVMCAMPVYRDGKLAAVVGADLYLDNMAQAVADTEEKDGYVCIVNERGHVIFSPKKEGIFQVREGAEAPDLRRHENEPLAAFIREALVEDVEREINNSLEQEVTTIRIGELVMSKLKDLDEVAYVRFASVYRSFKDINTFMEELKLLLGDKDVK